MKLRFPLAVLCLVGATVLHAQQATQQVYARGMRAYMAGDIDTAKVCFAQVLAADPKNLPAAAMMRRIAMQQPAGADLRKQAESIVLPKVDFRDASLSSVLDYLRKDAAEQSHGKAAINIVSLFPADYGRDKTITLQLSNVPLASVLDYVAQLGGLKLDYQAHAIVASLLKKTSNSAQ
jgi:hypothetical protein